MKCRRLAEIIPELVSGELDEITAREAEEHIRRCAACASEREKYEKALGALERFQIKTELPAALDRLNYPAEKGSRPMSTWRWIPAAGAAAAALVVAIMLLWSGGSGRVDKVHKMAADAGCAGKSLPVRAGQKPSLKGGGKLSAKAPTLTPTLSLKGREGSRGLRPRLRKTLSPNGPFAISLRKTLSPNGQQVTEANSTPAPVSVEQAEVTVEYVDSDSLPVLVQRSNAQDDAQVAAPPIPILGYRPHGPVLATREYIIEDGNRRISIYYQIDAYPDAGQRTGDNKIKEP